MATTVTVVLPSARAAAAAEVFSAFREVEATSNEWQEGSPLAAVNAAAGGDPVAVPPDVMALVKRGIELGKLTDGAFDVTWAALWGLWDFRAEHPVVPDASEVAARAALVDYRAVELDEAHGTIRLPKAGMKLGLGGIAKGWALDQAAERLRADGVTDFHIVAGGQVMAAGHRGDRPWRVGIRDPRGGMADVWAKVEVSDQSVSTSGDYERWFEKDDKRYHHVLDPRTGWPTTGVRSATVIAPSATDADALSTALMVMGVDKGMALVATLDGVEAVMVDEAGAVHATPGARLEQFEPPRR